MKRAVVRAVVAHQKYCKELCKADNKQQAALLCRASISIVAVLYGLV
jgi:hypothetical protein